MSEGRDPAIKLFGSTIPLPEELPAADREEAAGSAPAAEPTIEEEKYYSQEKAEAEAFNAISVSREQKDPECTSSLNAVGRPGHEKSNENGNEAEEGKPGQEHKEFETSGQDKVVKKPDRILPCPRCSSMDTKFCYYNNYNVNQPRYFCKNCQRYWTAGGTMRNVPVGAGRRKAKHSISNHRRTNFRASDGLASARFDGRDSVPCGPSASSVASAGNGTVLKFGPDAPLCQSMASVLNLGEKVVDSELKSVACTEEPSCSSSAAASNRSKSYCNGFTPTPFHHLQCFPGLPWVYPWNSGWNNVDGSSSKLLSGHETPTPSPIPFGPSPSFTAPAFCVSPLPFHFFPASFWAAASWNQPWLGASNNNGLSPSSSSTSTSNCSGNGSPTLGKHCRDGSSQGEEKKEKSLWVPKTLRIDDPEEAAKSSILTTLGIKTDEGGLFQAFKSKAEHREPRGSNQALKANPAALSRSRSFQETTS